LLFIVSATDPPVITRSAKKQSLKCALARE